MKTKEEEKLKFVLLLLFRCEYIGNENATLTKKGKGILTPKLWRRWNEFRCLTNKKHNKRVMSLLEMFARNKRENEETLQEYAMKN